MKLRFKQQQFQLDAVDAIADLFQGQSRHDGVHYMVDPGRRSVEDLDLIHDAYHNAPIELDSATIKERVNATQTRYGLRPSEKLSLTQIGPRQAYNFSIEMETGTGKTYTYIRTIMELNKRYGWIKFIIVVPSVAIREGVLKSFEVMSTHFQMEYGKKPRYFVYDSSRLGDLDSFANSSDLQVMIINSQAFNARGKDARRIHMEQESFRYCRPIDVLAAMHPIMIIDEPQSVEGKKTKEGLQDFKPLFTLRYSATHKEKYDMVYRLDAMDAYNQKLVKKIAVKAIEQSGTTGAEGYLYLQEIVPQKSGAPKARIEFEFKGKSGVRKRSRLVEEPFDLYAESGNLAAYKGMTLSHFDARDNKLQIGANKNLYAGEVIGQVDEDGLRAIQIRETIASHLEREEGLFNRGIKVLSLFFIDEVAKYKQYDEHNDPFNGTYAEIFEKEYARQVQAYIEQHEPSAYRRYLEKNLEASSVHAGYFSVDKVKKSDKVKFVDYKKKSDLKESTDTDAYDLIMKDKERLLSFEEPVRFIFSHSALKEGWDNPNVFQICTLKKSSADDKKRQEIGRGMRLAVDQNGIRQDQELLGADVHEINKLTVIANESYDDFSRNLQTELQKILSERPSKVDVDLFVAKVLTNETGQQLPVTKDLAEDIQFELIKQDYIDRQGQLTEVFFKDKEAGQLKFPTSVAGFESEVMRIIDSIYTDGAYPVENAMQADIALRDEVNEENLSKQEFQKLWQTIHHKTSYRVAFDEEELITNCVAYLNDKLAVSRPSFTVTHGEAATMSQEQGLDFTVAENGKQQEYSQQSRIGVAYDLLGEIAEQTSLTRKTIAQILRQMAPYKFDYFKQNPEEFILKTSRLIEDQKASQIVNHIQYNVLDEVYDSDLFYETSETGKPTDRHFLPSDKGVYRYTKVDSDTEKQFQEALEQHEDVKVYVKLPHGFKISTPLGQYNPDWAIAFKEGSVKHVYFVAETKGSLSSLQLKAAEEAKINCAKAHFRALKDKGLIPSDHVYGVVSNYQELLDIVRE